MSEETPGPPPARSLPDTPNLDWLRKQAKRRLDELRRRDPAAQLADAQFDLAKAYGFTSWRALKAHIDSLTIDGQLFDAAREGDVGDAADAARRESGQAARAREAVRSGRCCTPRRRTGGSASSICC